MKRSLGMVIIVLGMAVGMAGGAIYLQLTRPVGHVSDAFCTDPQRPCKSVVWYL